MKTPDTLAQEIRCLTNQELVQKIDFLTKEERRITIEVLRLLREIERRQLFAELGYPSLFAYCTKGLFYSEAAACRRIEAMRAMRETPEIETKLETGELSLSAVTLAHTTLRQFEKFANTEVSPKERKDVMLSLCGQSKRETEKVLARQFSTPLPIAPVLQTETANGTTRVTIELTADEMRIFDEIKRLSGHPQNLKETLLRLAAKELTVLKKSRGEMRVREKKSSSVNSGTPPAEVKNVADSFGKSSKSEKPRAIAASVKRFLWQRAGGRCEFHNANGKRCGSRHALEYDHIIPVALGGLAKADNLRVYCRQHNVFSATQNLGSNLMAKYIPTIR